MKNLFSLILIAAVFTMSCNNTQSNKKAEANDSKEECTPSISVDSFLVVAIENVGKELTVMGTVDHVCKHGGKRVKIFSDNPSKTIHGEAGEEMGAFKAELEGSDVCLTGIVLETKIDLAYVDEWEAKVKKAMDENADEADMEHKKGVDHHAELEQIKKHREEIEASETGYIAFYALEVSKYTECSSTIEEVEKPCCSKKDTIETTASAPCSEKKEGSGCCGDKKEGDAKPCGSES